MNEYNNTKNICYSDYMKYDSGCNHAILNPYPASLVPGLFRIMKQQPQTYMRDMGSFTKPDNIYDQRYNKSAYSTLNNNLKDELTTQRIWFK